MGNNPVSIVDPTGGWGEGVEYADYMDQGFSSAMAYAKFLQGADQVWTAFDRYNNRMENASQVGPYATYVIDKKSRPKDGTAPTTTIGHWVYNPNQSTDFIGPDPISLASAATQLTNLAKSYLDNIPGSDKGTLLKAFGEGAVNSAYTDITYGFGRKDPRQYSNDHNERIAFAMGQLAGDVLAMGISEPMQMLGESMIAAGIAEMVVTAEGVVTIELTLGGAVTVLGGAAVTATSVTTVYFAMQGSLKTLNIANQINESSDSNKSNGGTQVNSKTLWKGEGKERIDVENPNPTQRPGQIHYQGNDGSKYIYEKATDTFKGAPKNINKLLELPSVRNAITKGLKYLGEE
jgi:hypothetical protein